MKKVLSIFIVVLTVIFIAASCGIYEDNNNGTALSWVPEKSGFKDYKIDKDKIMFCYSIYFINNDVDACELSLAAKFEKSELDGWFSLIDTDDEFLFGLDENGRDKYIVLKPKEKKKVDFWFEGKYAGGKVNTNLSFPEYFSPTIY